VPVHYEYGGNKTAQPEADSDQVEEMAERLAEEARASGARGAFVAGEPTLTVALVEALRARGVRCFSATTARDIREMRERDGAVHKESVFRFVRWREYC
jgi:phosphoribosylamine-glycine ligase